LDKVHEVGIGVFGGRDRFPKRLNKGEGAAYLGALEKTIGIT
jgi:hypothetical protein